MLAPHRDQENQVHGHQTSAKQQLKTPRARYPKTPLRLGQNDGNVPTIFARKGGINGVAIFAGNDKLMSKGIGARQALLTPLETQTRAPLGNKTTNAKARTGQGHGAGIEKTQGKQTASQKPKQKPNELALRKLIFESNSNPVPNHEEPEYAPPQPTDLPYQSDVLPEVGLTFEGLKKENILRGYYEYFYNPVDENGVSRMEKQFTEEMKTVMQKAVGRNERDAEELTWNVADFPEEPILPQNNKPHQVKLTINLADKRAKEVCLGQPPMICSQRAVSALVVPLVTSNIAVPAVSSNLPATKSLRSFLRGNNPDIPVDKAPNFYIGGYAGESASRATAGYSKGRSASTMLHHRGQGISSRPCQIAKAMSVQFSGEGSQLTVSLRQGVCNREPALESQPRPLFLPTFNEDYHDGDLSPLNIPDLGSDDEDFELKLDI